MLVDVCSSVDRSHRLADAVRPPDDVRVRGDARQPLLRDDVVRLRAGPRRQGRQANEVGAGRTNNVGCV